MVRRIVYRLACGELPDDMFVITKCNDHRCVRHSHLLCVTKEDVEVKLRNSMATGVQNGRYTHPESTQRGEQINTAKLIVDDIRVMRRLYDLDGVLPRDLAIMFGIHPGTAWKVVTRRTWKHVDAHQP